METEQRNEIMPVDGAGLGEEASGEVVKPFTEHLEDLRFVLIKSLAALGICSAVCLYFAGEIMRVFEWPLNRLIVENGAKADDVKRLLLRSLHPADAFMISIKVVVVTGLIVASPLIIYFLWQFVSPGLTSRERRTAVPIFAGGLVFFLAGVAFCYFVVLRICLSFFYSYTVRMAIQPDWTIDNYISFVSLMLIAFGVVFEMPVVAALLAKFRLITSQYLCAKRLMAWFIIAIIAALVTPPDVLSQILLIVPMIGLYEISILIIRVIEKREQRV